MMTYTELMVGNGNIPVNLFEDLLRRLLNRKQGVPLKRLLKSVSTSNPLYIVGLETVHPAEGVGAWVDGNRLYLDPIITTTDYNWATYMAQRNRQVAIFKMTGVAAYERVVCTKDDFAPLYETLKRYSDKYGGATAVPVKGGFLVIGGEGEVVYL